MSEQHQGNSGTQQDPRYYQNPNQVGHPQHAQQNPHHQMPPQEYQDDAVTSSDDVNEILQDLQSQHQPQMDIHPSMMQNLPSNMGRQSSGNFDGVMEVAKDPLTVSCLYVILNLKFFDELLSKYLGGFLGEEGTSSIKGVLIKALLLGVLFYLTSKFIV